LATVEFTPKFRGVDREPQLRDKVKTPMGSGEVVARSETIGYWLIGVKLDKGGALWKGSAHDVGLLEAAGESELHKQLDQERQPGEGNQSKERA
jgi:hypothetical protein